MMGLNFILWALLLAHSFQRTSCTHNRYRILKTRTTTSPTNIPDSSPVCRGASVKSTLKCCIIFICVTNVIKTHRATCWGSLDKPACLRYDVLHHGHNIDMYQVFVVFLLNKDNVARFGDFGNQPLKVSLQVHTWHRQFHLGCLRIRLTMIAFCLWDHIVQQRNYVHTGCWWLGGASTVRCLRKILSSGINSWWYIIKFFTITMIGNHPGIRIETPTIENYVIILERVILLNNRHCQIWNKSLKIRISRPVLLNRFWHKYRFTKRFCWFRGNAQHVILIAFVKRNHHVLQFIPVTHSS